ncbi:MAG: DUF1445 domain-containing protein [Actinobacteria bacterium]|nr:DUF1445 domain-containing protein [Actinomycetota bacterium]
MTSVRAAAGQGTTRGLAPGRVQCNVVILPAAAADGFGRWCDRNPAVAPVLARSAAPGDPRLPALGQVDLRTDLPAYRVFEDGREVAVVEDLGERWTEDLVGFAFGCSFSLEEALQREGVPLDYARRGFGGAIYETSLETVAVDGFAAPLVVSMRPLPAAAVDAAHRVSERYPQLHGAPVHAGDPAAIGVDLDHPLDAIGEVEVGAGEVPVFWACGVTTQLAIESARPPRAFTHVSSRMLITELRLEDLEVGGPG